MNTDARLHTDDPEAIRKLELMSELIKAGNQHVLQRGDKLPKAVVDWLNVIDFIDENFDRKTEETPASQDNEIELKQQFVKAMWDYFGIEEEYELAHFADIFESVVSPFIEKLIKKRTLESQIEILEATLKPYLNKWQQGEFSVFILETNNRLSTLHNELKELS